MNMVKKIAIAAAFFGAVTVASAQEDNGFKIGARAQYSIQMATCTIDYVIGCDWGTVGAGAGVVFKIPVGPVAIAPGVGFLYRENATGSFLGYEFSQTEFAISIPVAVQWSPPVPGLYIEAGVQADIPLGAEICSTSPGRKEKCVALDGKLATEVDEYGDVDTEQHDERAAFDLGILTGVGYMITPNLGVDYRWIFGLTDFITHKTEPGHLDLGTTFGSLSTMAVGVTYYF